MNLSRPLLVLLLVATLLAPLAPVAAQDGGSEIDALVDAAIASLSAELGVTITRTDLDSWNWQEEFFPDASLGCPQPDMAYAQVLTRGFIITLTYAGTRYEYHLTPDAQTIVLCESVPTADATTAPPASTPTAADGMPATTTLTPDQLLDVALNYLSDQLGTSITRPAITRWTWEEQVWPDTSLNCPAPDGAYDASAPVRGYSLSIEYVDQRFEVHMTPDGRQIMPCGDDPRLQPALEGEYLPATSPTSANAGQPASPELAATLIYTGRDGNVYRTTLADFPGLALTTAEPPTSATPGPLPTPSHLYGQYRWSPDGTHVAFTDSVPPASLYLIGQNDDTPRILSTPGELAPLYPPAWSADGTQIAFVKPTQTFRGGNQVMEIYAVQADDPAATPRLITTFDQQVGCGGGSGDPADAVYNRETGFMGNPLSLEWLEDGSFVLTPTCAGLGLIRLDPASGETTQLHLGISRVTFNPTRTQAIGLLTTPGQTPQIVRLDLATGATETVNAALNGTPDQLYWQADGETLFVGTVDILERKPRTGTQDTIAVYTVRLWEVDLNTGQAVQRFESAGRGIGRMTELPSGALVFSFVEDARNWLSAVESGADTDTQRDAAPAARLFQLAPGGEAEALGYGGQPAAQPITPSVG
ncbi:MAG: hypothetical protein Kow0077_30100 [Anaerolineae bacterium]